MAAAAASSGSSPPPMHGASLATSRALRMGRSTRTGHSRLLFDVLRGPALLQQDGGEPLASLGHRGIDSDRLAVLVCSVIESSHRAVGVAQIAMGVSRRGTKTDRRAVLAHGVVELTARLEGSAEKIVALRARGGESNQLAALLDCIAEPTAGQEGSAEIVVDPRDGGGESDGLAVLADRIVEVPLRVEGSAEIVVGLRQRGFDSDGLAVLAYRVVDLALRLVGGSESVVSTSIGWLDGNCRHRGRDRLVCPSLLRVRDPEIAQRIGVRRSDLQRGKELVHRFARRFRIDERLAEVVVGTGL